MMPLQLKYGSVLLPQKYGSVLLPQRSLPYIP